VRGKGREIRSLVKKALTEGETGFNMVVCEPLERKF